MKQLILVVDGDASCRDTLRTTLQASGYDVAVLYNAGKVVRVNVQPPQTAMRGSVG